MRCDFRNIFNCRTTTFQNLERLTNKLTLALSEDYHANKESLFQQIQTLFIEKSEQLIGELALHPEQHKTYSDLRQCLSLLDQDNYKEFLECVISIQKISNILRKDEIEKLDSFTRQISNNGNVNYFLNGATLTFCDLHLSEDINQIRSISHPYVRNRVMAQLINRDQIPLNTLNLSKKELMDIGPHLTFLDCRNIFDGWKTKEIDAFLNSCPNLITLEINALQITKLPPLRHCRKLNCSGCTCLGKLPPLPNCRILDCHMCTRLKRLPELPDCHTLDCSTCPELYELPSLPNCHTLNCNWCSLLEQLPPLPNCHTLNFIDCFSLDQNSIPLSFKSANKRLLVNVNDLNDNPLKVLLELGPRLLNGHPLPIIRLIEKNGSISEGEDAVALRKSVISRLIKSLKSHAEAEGQLHFITDPNLGLMPYIDSSKVNLDDQIEGFQILGTIFMRSMIEGCLTGNHFHPALFQMICSFSYDELDKLDDEAGNLSNELRLKLRLIESLDNKNMVQIINNLQKKPTHLNNADYEQLKDLVINSIEEEIDLSKNTLENRKWVQAKGKEIILGDIQKLDTHRAVALIAKTMHFLINSEEVWSRSCMNGSQKLQSKIEGTLTKQEFISAISLKLKTNKYPKRAEKIEGFLEKWISEATIDDIKKLTYTITGSDTLREGQVMKFELYNREPHRLPEVHACFSSIEFSINCPNYKMFKEKLNTLITQSISEESSGYQFR